MDIPDILPVMLLSRCNVMPHGMLPLFIFEPRYRAMLAHALKHERMFCVGTLLPRTDPEDESDHLICPGTTAGMVRACVGHPDGTSHLVLQGVQRLKIVSWEQYEPFRLARVEPIPTAPVDTEAVLPLVEALLDQTRRITAGNPAAEEVCRRLEQLPDPEVLTDVVAANFVPDAWKRQPLLEMRCVEQRLRFLSELLGAAEEA